MEREGKLINELRPLWLEKFIDTYQKLGTDNLHLLADIYADNVVFIDPMHHISGYQQLADYFAKLYSNIASCKFTIDEVIYQNDNASIYWTMQYQHPKLNRGKTVTVQGHSKLRGVDDKVNYHRDYLDLGAMLYEHIPLLGSVIKRIKRKASA